MNLNMLEMFVEKGFNARMLRVGREEFVEVIIGEKIFWLSYVSKEGSNEVEVGELARIPGKVFSSMPEVMKWIESQ